MKHLITISLLTAISGNSAFSQEMDSSKPVSKFPTISGSVDAYYRYNFDNPKNAPYNSITSFTHSNNSFELGMASIRADHSFGKVSATVDLGFGRRAEEFAYNDVGSLVAVKQLYVSYALSNTFKFTFGSWGTHIGYEMLDAYLNRNYSMSYMFTNGPFSHTGIKTDINLGGKSALMLGIINPTDFRSASGMPKTLIGQFSTASKNDKLKIFLNFLGGKQNSYKKLSQGDIVATYAFSGKFNLGINGTLQFVQIDADSTGKFSKSEWGGLAVYMSYDPVNWFGITLRTEYINDKDNYLGLNSIIAPTLSANFKIDNLTIIPEFRFDQAGNQVFYKTESETTKSTGSFILAATYHF